MIRSMDHVTIVVTDLPSAQEFFGLLGFEEAMSVVVSGDRMAAYMGVENIEADHVTLRVPGTSPRLEVQLLRYRHPNPIADPNVTRLNKVGLNHICFVVDDIEEVVRRLTQHGVQCRNEMMTFHDRKLVFLSGPEGITVELAEWQ